MFLPQLELTEFKEFVEVITQDGGVSSLVRSRLARDERHRPRALFQQPRLLNGVHFVVVAHTHHRRHGGMVEVRRLRNCKMKDDIHPWNEDLFLLSCFLII